MSTQRTPEQQANAMLDNIARPGGVARNLRLYGTAGNQVVQVAAAGLNNGLSRDETVTRMTEEINILGPQRVSCHTGDPNVLNVLDITRISTKKGRFYT